MDWDSIGDSLVDLRAAVEHIRWHAESVHEPMTRLADYAFRQAE